MKFNNIRLKEFVFLLLVFIAFNLYPQNYIKIMPLGNSITFDTYSGDSRPDGDKFSYRYKLYQNLIAGGYNFVFIGSEKSGYNYLPTDPVDYSYNAGFPGITAAQLITLLQTADYKGCQLPSCPQNYLEYYKPDVILLHIGTNGLNSESDADAIISNVETVMNIIDTYESNNKKKVPVFLAQIINRAPDGSHAPTSYYNTKLSELVSSRSDDDIVLVNMESGAGIDYQYSSSGGDMKDDLHPDVSGYNKMGNKWYNAIDGYNFTPILDDAVFSLPENSPAGTNVGTLTGRDLDPGTTLTYNIISQNPANAFSINASTGVISVSNSTLLDYETNPVFTLNVRVSDGSLYDNAQITINLTNINEPPVLSGVESSAISYTENSIPTPVTSAITVADSDNTSLTSATVAITTNYHSGQDILSFTPANGITSSWNPSSGTLTLSGTSLVANYQTALRDVRYQNTSDNPSVLTRTVSFTVSDGTLSSNTVTRNISVTAVNDAPVLNNIESSALTYTENSVPTPVTSAITVADSDNTSLTSATVIITNNYQNGQDILSFTPANGITSSWNPSSGTLTLSGTSLVANYQAALRDVRYENTSDNPSALTRTVSFTVSDGSLSSNTVTRNITVVPVNDPPVAANVTITPTDDRIGIQNNGNYSFTDPEGNSEGTSTFKWYRANSSSGSGATAISGATGKSYVPVKADGGKWICFEVTPVDQFGLAGDAVKSPYKYINAAPVASNVNVYAPDGADVGKTIRGRYTYSDLESDPRGIAVYQWYRTTSANPSASNPGTAISTDSTYKLKSEDSNKYLWFKVKPVATSGSTPGDSVWSNVFGPVGSFSANISGTATYCPGVTMTITLTITGGTSPYSATLRRTGSSLNKDTTISGISGSSYPIQVKIPGTYTLLNVVDSDEQVATITGSTVTLSNYSKPTVKLTGSAQICMGNSTQLLVDFVTGNQPYTFSIRKNVEDPVTYSNVTKDTSLTVHLSGKYAIISLSDRYCTGDTVSGYGSATISYITSPFATLSGTDTVCPGDTARLTVALTGTPPWSITYLRNGVNPKTVSNITQSNYTLKVVGDGTYTLSAVSDAIRSGCVSGSGKVVNRTTPTANITGVATICEHTSYDIRVTLTGTLPWNFSYHRGTEPAVQVTNVITSPYFVTVNKAGTYTLIDVYDKYCKGTVSGSSVITVTPAPEVTITGLYPAYSMQVVWDTATVTPHAGTLIYDPDKSVITYNNNDKFAFSPKYSKIGAHTIIYKYRDPATLCYGYDTTIVMVLEANADIVFPENDTRKFFCYNEPAFTIYGYNTANDTGSFAISGGIGLVDHHDNTATIYPSQLSSGKYTVTYNYYDNGAPLSISEEFEVEVVSNIWFIGFDRTSFCDNENSFKLNGNMLEGIFSGRAVYGNLSSGFYFDPKLTIPGPDTVFYTYTTTKGCSRQVFKAITIRDAANINFTVDDTCVSHIYSDSTAFINLTTYTDPVVSWLWNFDDIGSGSANTSTLKNPKHKFTSAGRRDIRLSATTSLGCTSTREIRFNFGDKPDADFEWATECYHQGQKVKFVNTSSIDPDKGTIIYNKWKFYSGQSYDSIISRNADYLFSAAGNYNVELTVLTNYGCFTA